MDITIETLATIGGCTAVVTALTQIVKHYIKIDPKWIALILSLIIQVSTCAILGDLALMSLLIAVINAVLVTGASVGLYEGVNSVKKCIETEEESK